MFLPREAGHSRIRLSQAPDHASSFETGLWCWMGPRSPGIIRHLILFLSILAALTVPCSLAPHLSPSKPFSCCCLHPPQPLCPQERLSRSKAVLRQGSRCSALPLRKEVWIPTSHCSTHPGNAEKSKNHPFPLAWGPMARGSTGERLARLSLGRVYPDKLRHIPAQSRITRDNTTPVG